MGKRVNIIGQRFGKLTVVSLSDQTSGKGRSRTATWECKCDCGTVTHHVSARLRNGHVKSCGCSKWIAKHGYAKDGQTAPEYWVWNTMRQRCGNPNSVHYVNYGGRGITVCDRWADFANFIADMGRRPHPDLTIERKDNAQGYSPDNCIWATATMQVRNRRVRKTSVSGITGVSRDNTRSKWIAHIEGKNLGRFENIEDAAECRRQVQEILWRTE